jgi:hypothetical protein
MGDTRGKFTPPDGSINVRLVSGNEGLAPVPEIVATSGLNTRFAVIQETFVKDCVDVYFDEALWRTLMEFVTSRGDSVTVLWRWTHAGETSLDAFLSDLGQTDPEDREPPWALLVRMEGKLTLTMVTEYWEQVGGPAPYHDSYTYSLFSEDYLGDQVISALAGAPTAERWRIASEIVEIPPDKTRASPIAPGWLARLLVRVGLVRRPLTVARTAARCPRA